MSPAGNLPVSETLAVFLGLTGYDWLTEGNAEPLTAMLTASIAGIAIFVLRRRRQSRDKD